MEDKLLFENESLEEYLCYQVYGNKQECKNCSLTQKNSLNNWSQRLIIHHKNGNHLDVSKKNLIVVCRKCHPKLDQKMRNRGSRGKKIIWKCLICGKEKLLLESESLSKKTCSYKCNAIYLQKIFYPNHPEIEERKKKKLSSTIKRQFSSGQRVSNFCNETQEDKRKRVIKSTNTRKKLIRKGTIIPFDLKKYMKENPLKHYKLKECLKCNKEYFGYKNSKYCDVCRKKGSGNKNITRKIKFDVNQGLISM